MRLDFFSVNNKVDAFTSCSSQTSKCVSKTLMNLFATVVTVSSFFFARSSADAMVVGALDGAAESVRNDVRTYPL